MRDKEIQAQINKAQTIKKHIERWVSERDGAISERTRSIDVLNRLILKACEKYDEIYNRLTKDAARNRWSISDFNVNDYFDYETFDYDVSYLKS